MSDRDALLKAIADAPHDDAPRLVYADWCAENGLTHEETEQRMHVKLKECVRLFLQTDQRLSCVLQSISMESSFGVGEYRHHRISIVLDAFVKESE